jgi:ferredoxin
MAKYRVEFDRENCIGAGACVATNADWWSIDQDGKATLKSSTFDEQTKLWILDIEEADLQKQMDAAGVCPVTVIHITEIATGKKLI